MIYTTRVKGNAAGKIIIALKYNPKLLLDSSLTPRDLDFSLGDHHVPFRTDEVAAVTPSFARTVWDRLPQLPHLAAPVGRSILIRH